MLIFFERGMGGFVQWSRMLVTSNARLRPVLEFAHDVQFFDHHVDQLFTGVVWTYREIQMQRGSPGQITLRTWGDLLGLDLLLQITTKWLFSVANIVLSSRITIDPIGDANIALQNETQSCKSKQVPSAIERIVFLEDRNLFALSQCLARPFEYHIHRMENAPQCPN